MARAVTKLELIVTYHCNSQCLHCDTFCGPHAGGLMSPAAAAGYMDAFSDTLTTVDIYGGEPTLFLEVYLEIIGAAVERGLNIGVFTNGIWGRDKRSANKIAKKLKQTGLGGVLFSVDVFHNQYVPAEHVERAIIAAQRAGLETTLIGYAVNKKYFQNPRNKWDKQTSELLKKFEGMPDLKKIIGQVTWCGRAAAILSKRYRGPRRLPRALCKRCNCGSFSALSDLPVDPYGWITICSGLAIGNALQKPIRKIAEEFRPERHPILKVLMERGPLGLAKLPQARGFRVRRRYIDKCHLCYDLRRVLRPYFPEYLAPSESYGLPCPVPS